MQEKLITSQSNVHQLSCHGSCISLYAVGAIVDYLLLDRIIDSFTYILVVVAATMVIVGEELDISVRSNAVDSVVYVVKLDVGDFRYKILTVTHLVSVSNVDVVPFNFHPSKEPSMDVIIRGIAEEALAMLLITVHLLVCVSLGCYYQA